MSQLFRLKNGTVLLSTEAPGGIYNSSQLKKIAELCSKELAIVKATEDQRLALFVKESEVNNVAQQLRAIGLGFRHYQDSLHQPVSCLGELCEDHEQPAMATAMEITKEVASIQLNAPLKIGVNGCARCCTPCHTLDISVVGDSSGYRISLGGKTKQMPEFASYFAEGVPAKELPKRLKAVIEAYKSLAEDGETLHDVIERCGVTDFVQALAPYSQDAAQREDPFANEASAESVPELEMDMDAEADLEVETASADEDEFSADAELSLEDDDLSIAEQLDDSNDSLEEIPIEQEHEGALEDDLPLQDMSDETSDDLEIDHSANIQEDDIDLDASELEASDDASVDDSNLELDSISLDDDLEGIPDLDDDITPEVMASPVVPPAPPVQAKTPAADLNEGFGEEMSTDMPDFSDEEESQFEQKLQASIDEESRMIARADKDTNVSDRAAALSLLEQNVDDGSDELELGGDLEDVAVMDDLEDDLSVIEDSVTNEDLQVADNLSVDDLDVVEDLEITEDMSTEEELGGDLELSDDLDAVEDIALEEIASSDDLELSDDLGGDLDVVEDLDVEEIASSDDLELSDDLVEDLAVEEVASSADLELSDDLGGDLEVVGDLDAVEDLELVEDEVADLEVAEDLDDLELPVEDEILEPINETMEEFPEPAPRDLAQVQARQLGQKLQGSPIRQQFKVSAISFQDEHMRVNFESGAYVDFDLSALGHGEERSFRLGVQIVSVTSTSEGYILEVDGMRLFHPKSSLPAAS